MDAVARRDVESVEDVDERAAEAAEVEELLDAIGLDYTTSEDDESQNEVKLILDEDEFCDVFETVQLAKANEQVFARRLLNPELAEYTTRVQVYTPQGDKICFS